MPRLVVQWPRFGPYHLARLRALKAACEAGGWHLVALETASTDALYAWEPGEALDGDGVDHRVLFPGRSFHEVSPRAMHRAMTDALERLRPDAVAIHSYAFPDARAALLWCRRRRRTAVLMFDSREDDAPRRGWREALKRRLVAQYDAALTAGTPQRRYLDRLGMPAARTFEGYDVVDNDAFAEAARRSLDAPSDRPGLDDPAPFFLASNRFIARKNLPALLDAFARYRARAAAEGHAPWRLVMLGDGALRDVLQRRADALGVTGAVAWPGFQQIEALPAYYARAGAFVHPCHADQWALVVNEAMACGLPVAVSTGAGCVEDLVREGDNGFAFDPDDVDGLAGRLFDLAHGGLDLAAMGQRSREIVAPWSLDLFARSMLAAAEAGAATAARGPDPFVALAIEAMQRLLRRVDAFHTVES